MRKTKCKECNNGACTPIGPCKGTGQIKVFTIQELREGKVWCSDDSTLEELIKVLGVPIKGSFKLYGFLSNGSISGCDKLLNDTPVQSVKIFLEEIEQEDKEPDIKHEGKEQKFKMVPIEEHEFKWGEEVEWNLVTGSWWPGVYIGSVPNKSEHVIVDIENNEVRKVNRVRNPQKLTLTLQQIADKFGVKVEQIKIEGYEKA